MGGYRDGEVPIIVRGDGCYLEDANGKRYLDALAGLFAVQIGYSYGEEIGEAAHAQMRELPFYTNWSYAHPRAIELAAEVARLAPGDLNRVFFVSGGSEAVESAWKLARQYHSARGERRWKAISRNVAYHGTTMGALSINGIPALRTPFEPLVPEVLHVRNTNRYHRPPEETEEEFTRFLLDDLEQTIEAAGPETVAMVIMEPVQNAGGAFTPPRGLLPGVREICDRYGILLCADEVITGFGRLGAWFGSERYDIRPDLITCAKGLSSAYASIGAVIATDRVMEPFLEGERDVHARDHVRRPSGAGAIALKNIEIMKREKIVEHVDEQQDAVRGDARAAARPADRRRPARHGLLLRARARQGQGDARDVLGRGVRDAAARLPLAAAVRARPDLPRRRPRRPGDPDLAAARSPARPSSTRSSGSSARARGGLAADLSRVWWLEEALAAGFGGEPAPPLAGDTDADVAIVGGGYTGLWTALALKEREPGARRGRARGRRVRPRAERAQRRLLPRLLEPPAAAARALRRRRRARRSRGRARRSSPACAPSRRRHGADVWLREGGMLRVSAAPAQDHAVGDEVEAARELGVPDEAVPLSREQLAGAHQLAGLPRGRLPARRRDRPARRGSRSRCARVALGSARLHERTRVTDVERRRGRDRAAAACGRRRSWSPSTRPRPAGSRCAGG